MPERPTEPEATEQAEASAGWQGRVARFVQWAAISRLRMILVGSLFFTLFGSLFATWSYLAHLAVDKNDQYTLAKALIALDKNDFEEAKNIIGEMQQFGTDAQELGGALYVLGAVKGAHADLEWSHDRQRAMHLVAARYLQKARELGVSADLKNKALFLAGRSLVRGNQPQVGIEVLETALDDKSLPTTKIHALLAEAYQTISDPDFSAALLHNQAVLNDTTLDPQRRDAASITQADILGKMGRLEEAEKYLNTHLGTKLGVSGGTEILNNRAVPEETVKKVGSNEALQARIKSISGRLAIAKAQRLPAGSPQRVALADQARVDLSEAQLLDPLNSDLTRQAMYWIGKSYEVTGDREAAIQRYDQLGKSYGDTPESMAAMLAKADLAREAHHWEQALAGYRAVLDTAGNPVTYVNHLLPFSVLRKRLLRAFNDFVDAEQFETAMALVDAEQPVFSLIEVTEQRAQTHEKWAQVKFTAAAQVAHWEAEKYLAKGRYHQRAAGAAYELLSEMRFSSRNFTADLWQAADNFYLGQSFSHAKRMLRKYLHHEAKKNQAVALLRLGQSHLALGNSAAAIETLEECIEMHPGDAIIYQARLECAYANLQQDRGKRAQELLLSNLVGGSLEPAASEWRDSLFLLGDYLHNSEQYQAAIKNLDEAVRRYPEAPQALFARYQIARSYHSASKKTARLSSEAKTENERLQNRKLHDKNLTFALENYLQVQRILTLRGHVDTNELQRTLLRNCYMMQGSVLFQLKRFEEARKAYANISTLYQNEPFVLESFVHIANCYRRLNKPVKAKGTIEQAKLVLDRLPAEIDFKLATNFSRQSWELLLEDMGEW